MYGVCWDIVQVIQNSPVPIHMVGSAQNCLDKSNNVNNITANNTTININMIYCKTDSGFCKNNAIHSVGRVWKYISLIIVADQYIWYMPCVVWITCFQLQSTQHSTCIMSMLTTQPIANTVQVIKQHQ